jgi:hypothetical protein
MAIQPCMLMSGLGRKGNTLYYQSISNRWTSAKVILHQRRVAVFELMAMKAVT